MANNGPNNPEEDNASRRESLVSTDPMLGKVLGGRFRVLSTIARGGMGKVYKAEQSPLNRIVALKVLDPSNGREEEVDGFRERFFLEASTCAKLNHPNTVRIFDYGSTWDDVFYIAMEYLEGQTLQQIIRTEHSVKPLRLIRIVKQICGSLHEAHHRGVIHRDLKPSNVLLTVHGDDVEFVKVLDFGLVKHLEDDVERTDAGRLLGSPLYMSPEQVRCEPLDVRTDVYSIGILMYVALTGQRPFKKTTSVSILLSQISEKPPPFAEINPDVSVPASLEWVVMRCLEKDRERRFADVRELLRALKACEVEFSQPLQRPLKLRLRNGVVVVPPGLLDSTPFDVSLDVVEDSHVDVSETFQFDEHPVAESRRSFSLVTGISTAGVMLAVALCLSVVVLVVILSQIPTKESSRRSTGMDDSPVLPSSPVNSPTSSWFAEAEGGADALDTVNGMVCCDGQGWNVFLNGEAGFTFELPKAGRYVLRIGLHGEHDDAVLDQLRMGFDSVVFRPLKGSVARSGPRQILEWTVEARAGTHRMYLAVGESVVSPSSVVATDGNAVSVSVDFFEVLALEAGVQDSFGVTSEDIAQPGEGPSMRKTHLSEGPLPKPITSLGSSPTVTDEKETASTEHEGNGSASVSEEKGTPTGGTDEAGSSLDGEDETNWTESVDIRDPWAGER